MKKRLLPARLYRQLRCSFLLKWLPVSAAAGVLAGIASAIFLMALNAATDARLQHPWLLYALPFGGMAVVALYHYFGAGVAGGNNQLIEEIEQPRNIIPLRMALLVLAGTLLTHLFGGSAGREGTAVQMGGSIADQLGRRLKLRKRDRIQLLLCGISAGFAAVFGTPLAGAVFALEVPAIGRLRYEAAVPALLSAWIAHYCCMLFPVRHAVYRIAAVPDWSLRHGLCAVAAGIVFGLAARCFSLGLDRCGRALRHLLPDPFLRVAAGGVVVLILLLIAGPVTYAGLGIPVIRAAFSVPQAAPVFALKMILTILTLACGFKGGEVTPLFFIGATLGSALSVWLPLPVGLLAGMGFAAVFCGAANTPVACILMGMELFGWPAVPYIALACGAAYLCSGHKGIYSAQRVARAKHPFYKARR